MIKFMKHYVTNGKIKARVTYSAGNLTDGSNDVVIQAKDYSDKALPKIFSELCKNDSDIVSSYHALNTVRITESDALYASALQRAKVAEMEFRRSAERARQREVYEN